MLCCVLCWGLAALKPCLHFGDETDPSAGLQPIGAQALRLLFSLNEENSAAARLNAVTWGRGGKKRSLPEMILVTGSCIVVFSFFPPSSSSSSPPAQHRVAFLFPPSGPFFFLGWASVPMMISKVKNAMSTLVGGMMPHGHHHHHNHHSGGGQTCGPDSLPPRFPYGRPDFLDLTPELLQYSTEHASRPVLTLKRDSRLHWRTGYAEWVGLIRSLMKTSPPLLKKSFTISRYCLWGCSPDESRACGAAAVSALQQPNDDGQHGLLLLYTYFLSATVCPPPFLHDICVLTGFTQNLSWHLCPLISY